MFATAGIEKVMNSTTRVPWTRTDSSFAA
jgi:hypothetical protein